MPGDAGARYGPNGLTVTEYMNAIGRGFLFNRLGRPDESDGTVHRVPDWPTAKEVVYYDLENGSPDNSPYLKFLATVVRANKSNRDIAAANGLAKESEQARRDASHRFGMEAEEWDKEFQDFVFSREEPYPFWRFSIQDHCAYIAAELVVAHVTDVHLLRDMWYWYQRGHWPCGWDGGWPEGRLIVF